MDEMDVPVEKTHVVTYRTTPTRVVPFQDHGFLDTVFCVHNPSLAEKVSLG